MILSAGIVDLLCWRILILQRLAGILSINVPSAKTTMTFHSPRTIVVTGRHGEALSSAIVPLSLQGEARQVCDREARAKA